MIIKEEILKSLQEIPYWKVVSYKILANKFKSHPRVIARILASNIDQDKYPCYKVVNSDLRIWGYNLGITEKIKKLEKEWIHVNNGRINKKDLIINL